jgi:hypothetical protein
MGCGIKELPRTEQLSRERGREKAPAISSGAMENQNCVADQTRFVPSRPPERGVVDAELGDDGAVRELKVPEDEIILVACGCPAGASQSARIRLARNTGVLATIRVVPTSSTSPAACPT